MELAPHQREAVNTVIADYQLLGVQRQVVHMATGAGKTYTAAALASQLLLPQQGAAPPFAGRCLFLAHRDTLLTQAFTDFARFFPLADLGIVQAEKNYVAPRVIFGSVQTLENPRRLREVLRYGQFDLVFVDECHHATAPSYRRIIGTVKNPVTVAMTDAALLVGLTATPRRSDGLSLRIVFDQITHSTGILELITAEPEPWLVDLRSIAVEIPDLELSSLVDEDEEGDFNQEQLARAIEKSVKSRSRYTAALETIHRYSALHRLQGVYFGSSVADAYGFADLANAAGIVTEVVTGKTRDEDRDAIYDRVRRGETQYLSNMNVLPEGVDLPMLKVCIMGYHTKFIGRYIQCLDAQTEILTPTGWAQRGSLRQGDLVAGFDTTTNAIKWVPVQSVVDRPLAPNEQMYGIQSPTLDIRVTGGHRMLFRKKGRKDWSPWRIAEAQELAKMSALYQIPIAGFQDAPGVPLTDDELRFIGWFMTDGTLNRTNGQIIIAQAEHQPWNADIEACLQGCGFRYGKHVRWPDSQYNANSHSVRYTISKGQPTRLEDRHLRGWQDLEPYLDKSFSPRLEGITRQQLLVLLEAIHLGDGSKQQGQSWTRRSYHICTVNLIFAERLQSLCIRRGLKCNLIRQQYQTGQVIYFLHIKDTPVRFFGARSAGDRPQFEPLPTDPNEHVWCVENELGTLITRRNGKVAILGNCVGRITRIHPADRYPDKTPKPSAEWQYPMGYVIDLTDNAHTVVMLPDMLGTTEEKARGKSARELVKDKVIERKPQPLAPVYTPGSQSVRVAGASLFTSRPWRKHGADYQLVTPQGTYLARHTLGGDAYEMLFYPKGGSVKQLRKPLPLQQALGFGEQHLQRSEIREQGRTDQAFRRQWASAEQVASLAKVFNFIKPDMRLTQGAKQDLWDALKAPGGIGTFHKHGGRQRWYAQHGYLLRQYQQQQKETA